MEKRRKKSQRLMLDAQWFKFSRMIWIFVKCLFFSIFSPFFRKNDQALRLSGSRARFLHVSLCLCVLVSFFGCRPVDYSRVKVIYVYDGDTVKISTGERVRLIGIDCPESYESDKLFRDMHRTGEAKEAILAKGRAASAFTRNLVLGKTVRLEFDVQRFDRYNRLLAYIFLEDGTFVNALIMEKGFAEPMNIAPNERHKRILQDIYNKGH